MRPHPAGAALALAVGTLALGVCFAPARGSAQDTMQTAHKFKRKETRTLAADYLLFLPAGYNPRSSQNPKLYEWFLQHQRRPASARK